MAFQQQDPFDTINRNTQNMYSAAARDSADAQNALLSVFREETARQRPWADLPVDLAKQNNQYNLAFRNNMATAGMRAQAADATQQAKWANMAPSEIHNLISQNAKAVGLDPDVMLTIADIESKFKTNAKNPTSSAGGLYQQIDSNWAQYGGGGNKFDPKQNVVAAMAYGRDIVRTFQSRGIPINAGTMYLGWQQGPAGAAKLLSNPSARAVDVVGRDEVLKNGGRLTMSAGEFANLWMTKPNRNYEARLQFRKDQLAKRSTKDDEPTIAGLGNYFEAPDGEDVEIVD